MAKTKISEYSSTANSNTDIASINIDEGCAPSGINNAIRALMAQLKNFQTGADGDSFNGPVGSTTPAAGAFTTLSASSTLSVTGAGTIQGLTVGKGAGAVSTNTAVGASALAANTTGARTVAVGYQALASSDENDNTGVGERAGYSNTTGTNNSFYGARSGYLNTTGSYNTFLGRQSGYSNTTSSYLTAVGYQAGYANTGVYNSYFGAYTGSSNTSGAYNTFVGGLDASGTATAGANTTGSYNTVLGNGALKANTTASNNTAVGYQAGYTNSTGVQNTFVGYQAGQLTTGSYNCFVGTVAGSSTTGQLNSFIGYGAGTSVTSGSKNSILGAYSGNQGGLDIRTASNVIVLSDGDGNPRYYYNSGHYVTGINSGAGTYAMKWSSATGQITYDTSSARYKDNIRDSAYGLDAVMQIRSAQFEYKDDGRTDIGLIAEEVFEVIPELVALDAEGNPNAVSYDRFVSVCIKAIQELKAEFDAYKEAHP